MPHPIISNLLLTLPALVGIITLFGKKKDQPPQQANAQSTSEATSGSESSAGAAPFPYLTPSSTESTIPSTEPLPPITPTFSAPPTRPTPNSTPSVFVPPAQERTGVIQFDRFSQHDDPLNQLLLSLIQDNQQGDSDLEVSGYSEMRSTTNWVPPRATPPSRPMVLGQDDTGKKVLQPFAKQDSTVSSQIRSMPTTGSGGGISRGPGMQVPIPPPSMSIPAQLPVQPGVSAPSRVSPGDELKRPSKGDVSKPSPANAPAGPQGFEQIFELTQGALLSPGLVLVSGSKGAGKTSLCISLVDAFLKRGSPCVFVDYDQPPGALREKMKALGCDPAPRESSFRLLVVDGFSAQSESFSMEPYYVEKPLDLENTQNVIATNTGMFLGEKSAVIFDSLDAVVLKNGAEVTGKLKALTDKMRDAGATLVVTVTSDQVPKDLAGKLEEAADCVIDLEKSGSGGRLQLRKLKGSSAKPKPEDFEISAGKGLVFV